MLALVFANPFVNSSLGLEVVLVAALLTGLTAQAVRGSRVGFGVFAGLLVLARLDVGLIVAVVYLLTPALRCRPWVAPLTGAAVALPWYVFSWFALGSAIPTTFVIKTLQRSFGDASFTNGWWLMLTSDVTGTAVALAVVTAALGLVAALVMVGMAVRHRLPAQLWPLAGLGIGGAAHFGAYCLLQVPPYHWYYVPSTVALGVTAVLGLGLALRRVRHGRGHGILGHAVPVVTAVAFTRAGLRVARRTAPALDASGHLRQLGLRVRLPGGRCRDRRGGRRHNSRGPAGDRRHRLRLRVLDGGHVLRPWEDTAAHRRAARAGPPGDPFPPAGQLPAPRLEPAAAGGRVPRDLDPGPVPGGVPAWPTDGPGGPGTMYLEAIA